MLWLLLLLLLLLLVLLSLLLDGPAGYGVIPEPDGPVGYGVIPELLALLDPMPAPNVRDPKIACFPDALPCGLEGGPVTILPAAEFDAEPVDPAVCPPPLPEEDGPGLDENTS